jgi:two-component system, OmpR family, sensor kinase
VGRLFWKFFLFVWLAQLLGIVAVAALFSLTSPRFKPESVDAGPAARTYVDAAAAILRYGGKEAFRNWASRDTQPPVYAVDAGGADLLGRTVDPAVTAEARELHDADPDSPLVVEVVDPATKGSMLLFAARANRPAPSIAGGPPPGHAPPRAPGADSPPGTDRTALGMGPPPRGMEPPAGMGPAPPGIGPPTDMGPPPRGMGPPADMGPPRGEPPLGRPSNGWPRNWPPRGPLIATLLASLLTAALLAWYVAKPIRSLRRAFEAASSGRLDHRVAPLLGTRQDELADLGREFDRMAERLQDSMSRQKRLLHDVSHEVRSPLARLQAAAGLLRQKRLAAGVAGVETPRPSRPGADHAADTETARAPGAAAARDEDAAVDRIEEEIARIDQLVGDLLKLSRIEAGELAGDTDDVDLHELVSQVVSDADFEARALGRRILWTSQAAASLTGRAEMLHVAFENIVRNALKHAPESQMVTVETTLQGSRFHFRVLDSGPGVRDDELERLFTPFFRTDHASNTEGYGLGLAIARRSIEAHGGTIRAQNRPGGGLAVEIMLPLRAGDH